MFTGTMGQDFNTSFLEDMSQSITAGERTSCGTFIEGNITRDKTITRDFIMIIRVNSSSDLNVFFTTDFKNI